MKLLNYLGRVLLMVSSVGCSAVNFSASPQAATNVATGTGTVIAGGTCKISNISASVPVKVLFVVDRSGSNAEASMPGGVQVCTNQNLVGCSPATDPQLTFRGGSISSFFTANETNSAFSWGFLAFAGTSVQSYVLNGSRAVFGNAGAMQMAINEFYSGVDQGATPYLSALSGAESVIANDADLSLTGAQAPLYEIIFLSDGHPTDAVNFDGSVDMNEINSSISSILSLAPGRVFLSTVYYGTVQDATAVSTLQTMATVGEGQFVNADTGSTTSISFDNLITVPTSDCTTN